KPPVASMATMAGPSATSFSQRAARPAPLRATAKTSPLGRTATSRRSLATSIPTTTFSIPTRPCLIGLALRPRRLFGFDGRTGGAPGSPTVLLDPGDLGHPPAAATATLPPCADLKLQGDTRYRTNPRLPRASGLERLM